VKERELHLTQLQLQFSQVAVFVNSELFFS